MPKTDKDHSYTPLLTDSESSTGSNEKDVEDTLVSRLTSNSRHSRLVLLIVIAVEALVIVLLSGTLWMTSRNTIVPDCALNHYPQTLYSPAQGAIENVHKVFTMGFGKSKTIYESEPSPEVDEAWHDLYNSFGLSKIPKEQARLLPNKTLPIPGDEEYYAVGLGVFHQLHCLNLIRQGLRADYYADPITGEISGISKEDWPDHASHCVDNIRQALMCASDISLVVWQWVERDNRASIFMDTVHSCRNFDRIADWAKAHRRTTAFDLNIHVEDDIEIPVVL